MSEINNFSNFKFKKHLGQNFIYDTNLLQAICSDALLTKDSVVLEIGAGEGTLTQVLAKNVKRVISYEIDSDLKPILQKNLQKYDNVQLVFNDILKQDIKSLEQNIGEQYSIVANLPYYITTPIIFKFVQNAKCLNKMLIMVQKEVAHRLCALPGSKSYGIISVLLGAVANLKITRTVNRKMFKPVPNVDSAVVLIEFEKDKYDIADYNFFADVVRAAFNMRRKTLLNNLKSCFNIKTDAINQILKEMNLKPDVRGEQLSVKQFIWLSQQIKPFVN